MLTRQDIRRTNAGLKKKDTACPDRIGACCVPTKNFSGEYKIRTYNSLIYNQFSSTPIGPRIHLAMFKKPRSVGWTPSTVASPFIHTSSLQSR